MTRSNCAGRLCINISGVSQTARRKHLPLVDLLFMVQTLGQWKPRAHKIYKNLTERRREAIYTRDWNAAGFYFGQQTSIALQHGNAASILSTLPSGDGTDRLVYV